MASGGGQEEEDDIEALGLRDYIEAGARDWEREDLAGSNDRDVIRFRGEEDFIYPSSES
jgi:hypothetical protein